MAKIKRPGYVNGQQKMDDALFNYQDSIDDYEGNGYKELGKDQGYHFEGTGPSAMEKVSTDPKLREAQMSALQSLRDRSQKGMSLQDKADLIAAEESANSANRSRQDALRQEFAGRAGNSGASEAVMRMMGTQGAADQQARQARDVAARSEQNRINATQDLGNMSGNMRNQDFSEQSAKAAAADRIAQYNNTGSNQATRDSWGENNTRDRQNNNNYMGFQQNKMQANQQGAQAQYNAGAEQDNKARLEAQAEALKKKQRFGAFMGAAGGLFGAVGGGPAGASVGYGAGNAIGQSFAHGGKVEGPELTKGDHPINDVVIAKVSPGEIIVPKSLAQDGDSAKEFVDALNGKTGPSSDEIIANLFGTIEALLARSKR